jgi:hypothetical protein
MEDPKYNAVQTVGGTKSSYSFEAFPKRSGLQASQSFILSVRFVDEENPAQPFDISGATATLYVSAFGVSGYPETILAGGIITDSGSGTDDTVTFTVAKDLIPDDLGSFPTGKSGNSVFYFILEDADTKLQFSQNINVLDESYVLTGDNSASANVILVGSNDLGTVIDVSLNTPPVSPVINDAYIVASGGTGDWSGEDDNLAVYNGVGWIFRVPAEGNYVYDSLSDTRFDFNGTAWATFTPADGSISNAKLADMQSGTIKGRLTAGIGAPQDLTSAQTKQILGLEAVDNTSDADKPVSDAQAAINATKLDTTAQAADSAKYAGYTIDSSGISNGRVLAMKAGLTEFEFVDQAAGGGSGGFDFPFLFSTDTTATDPTSGGIKYDNATPASVTNIYISNTDNDGMLIDTLINSLGNGDQFVLKQGDTPANRIRFNVSGVTDNTGWMTIAGTVADSGPLPSNGASCGTGFEYVTGGGASGVTSVNGQTGAVTTVQDTDDLTNNSNIAGATTTDAFNTIDTGKAESAITITPSGGITSTAADLTASDIGLDLDIDSLPAEATPSSGDQLILFDGTQNKKFDWDLLPGAGGGEVNTISSVGSGTSLVSGKVGADLQMKSITFGANLTVSGVSATGFTVDAATGSLDTTQVNGWTGQQYFDATTLSFAANVDWNLNTNQVTELTLTGDATLNNPINIQDGATYILHVVQDGTGTHSLTFSSNYKFVGDAVPSITTNANYRDIFTFTAIGGNLYGTFVQGYTS